jgi:hypothetical protein
LYRSGQALLKVVTLVDRVNKSSDLFPLSGEINPL